MKKNKVGRPKKIAKRQYKRLPLMPSDVVPSPANIAAFSKTEQIDTKSGLVSTLKEGKGLEELKKQYDKYDSRFEGTKSFLKNLNEQVSTTKTSQDIPMIKDNSLFVIELDIINKRKEELETVLDEIRKLQRKTETLTLQIKWLELGLERWTK
jgi:hypothetical protein